MEKEPLEITAGDRLTWTIYDPEYLPSDGWTLHYAIRGPGSIDLTSTPDGGSHAIDVPGSTSKDYSPGSYSWARYFAKADGSRVTRTTGRLTIRPDLVAQGAGYDGSSHAERVLAAIERVIEGRATRGDQELQFDGKRITKMTVEQLIKLRQQYRLEVKSEQAKQAGRSGRSRKILVRFS